MTITRENLSFELKVGVALLEGPATLTELSERLGCDRRVVGRAIDVLTDQGQIKEQWAKRPSGDTHVHCREILLCDVARPFFEAVRSKLEVPLGD